MRSIHQPWRPAQKEERYPAPEVEATEHPSEGGLPAPTVGARRPAAATVEPERPSPPAPEPAEGLAAPELEVRLLGRAQGLLGTDPSAALDLLEEHRRRFPDGVHVQERERFAIEALLHLDRGDEARARAAAFAERWPRSPHRRRIRVLLGE